ncbi:MAG: hypothetical protein NTW86_08700 [Candidatus Sumerlaeota bacterium]|nr:hypothetical protein [Candidatus Sumerlaeota bacterium]
MAQESFSAQCFKSLLNWLAAQANLYSQLGDAWQALVDLPPPSLDLAQKDVVYLIRQGEFVGGQQRHSEEA